MKRKIGFIGTGKMAEALIKCILDANLADWIICSDKNEDRLKSIKEKLKVNATADNKEAATKSEVIFLSVKPQDMEQVLTEIKKEIKNQLIISIAAGIKIGFIESIIGNKKIVRVMPNISCLVREMAAGFSVNKRLDESDKEFVNELLNSAGSAILLTEEDLDAVTGLSGSGPAFAAYTIQAVADAGVKQGLKKEVALKLAIQTIKGTGKLLQETKMTTDELIKAVSSPGGTTVAGMEVLRNSDLKEVINDTIKAATKRSKELGKKQA